MRIAPFIAFSIVLLSYAGCHWLLVSQCRSARPRHRRRTGRQAASGTLACALAVLGIFSLCAAPARADEPSPLRAATFQADATPPLGSWLYDKPLATVEHPLLAKGVVLEDGAGRCVLVAVDWCVLANSSHRLLCERIAEAAGTDPRRVMVQCVHVHTGPVYDGDAWALLQKSKNPPKDPGMSDPAFVAEVAQRLAGAVKEAVGRLEVVDRIGAGQAKVERVASSRRIPTGDGKVTMRFSAATDPALQAAPEGFIDPMLKTITLAHGDRPVVRLHYYATHPQTYYRDGRASYDFVGMAREKLQEEEKVFQVYFTGCGGDVAAGKYNPGTPEARAGLAERLLAGMRAAVAATEFAPAGPITWRNVELRLAYRQDKGYSKDDKQAQLNDPKAANRDWAAMSVASAERAGEPITLGSLQIGRVHVLHLPGEPMVAFQLFAQEQLPGDFIAVAGYGDGAPGYLCTKQAFAEGGYEPTGSEVVPESETPLKEAIRKLLGLAGTP